MLIKNMHPENYNKLIISIVFLGCYIFFLSLASCNTEEEQLKQTILEKDSDIDSLKNIIYLLKEENYFLYHTMDSLPLGSPLDTLVLSSKFGWRKKPFGDGWQKHTGTDFLAAWHDTVYATGNGTVIKSGWGMGYGRQIKISHCGNYESTYAHLYRLFVRKGDSVILGQPIGRAGNSGVVTGPHLHYEILRNDKKTDPIPYIKELMTVDLGQ
jgi:murein DD-endopeptidase MepM/ murein hydrolase activator NlpD